jgi:uncharacterized protein YbaR (Trm112 family)
MPSLLAQHLDQLVCPVCHAPLALTPATVDCTACRNRYPIVDGLPVLIASRALNNPLPEPETASNRI